MYIYIYELLLFNGRTLIHAFNGIGRVWIITRRLSQTYIFSLQKQRLFLQLRATCNALEAHHQAKGVQNIKRN